MATEKSMPSELDLKRLYVKEKKSIQSIGKIYHVGPTKIKKLLVAFEIKVNPRGSWALGLTKKTDNRIRRNAESKIGVPRSSETIKKIRESGTLFKKNQTPWMKGKHHSEKAKKLLSKAAKGRVPPNKGKKGPTSPFKGQTKETNPIIKKRSITATGD